MKKKIIDLMKTHIDKVAHVLLATLFYAVVGLFLSALITLIATVVLAVLVEVYDKVSGKGTPDVWDIVATIVIPVILYYH